MLDCTLFLVVDDVHLSELLVSYPSWCTYHPEVAGFQHFMLYDSNLDVRDVRFREFEAMACKYGAPGLNMEPWSFPAAETQREKMLTAYIKGVESIKTKWYLKIDTDTFGAESDKPLVDMSWFSNSPAYIAKAQRVTRTGGIYDDIDRWAEGIPELAALPKPDHRWVPGKGYIHPTRRMTSWVMFGNTAWTRGAYRFCNGGRLPVPSQDTYLSYIALRTGAHHRHVNFKRRGWSHRRPRRK